MKNLIILLSCLLFAGSVYGWGQKGHDVTAYIAECHLTPEAAQKIDKVLNGHSPVYYCNWMDIASHTPEYNYTKTWHYLNIDEGQTLETMPRNPKGDVLTAVTTLVAELKAGGLAPEAETEKLKMLIHLVGDMHCPMHTGRLSDIGGNQRPVLMFGRRTNPIITGYFACVQVKTSEVVGEDKQTGSVLTCNAFYRSDDSIVLLKFGITFYDAVYHQVAFLDGIINLRH